MRRRSGAASSEGTAATTYAVDIAGQSTIVTVTPDGVIVDGAASPASPASLVAVRDSPLQLLRLGDAVYELIAVPAEGRGAYAISLRGVRMEVEALDERSRAVRSLRAASAVPSGPESIRAPMPGLVTRILVSAGDTVSPGTRLVVMEAMKMENELRAKGAARVRRIAVEPGTAVEKGTLLVELEAAEAGGTASAAAREPA